MPTCSSDPSSYDSLRDAPADVWTSRQPGTYLLLIHLPEQAQVRIGRLGLVCLPAGWYVYIGSALGGLGARISRHARQEKRPHWHIDYLLAAGRLDTVAVHVGTARIECATAQAVARLPGGRLPVPRFGASDCRCSAHLVSFQTAPDLTLGPDWHSTPAPAARVPDTPASACLDAHV